MNIQLRESGYWKSVELPNGIIVDVAEDGEIIAIEIIKASSVFTGDLKRVIEAATVSAN